MKPPNLSNLSQSNFTFLFYSNMIAQVTTIWFSKYISSKLSSIFTLYLIT